MIPLFSSIRLFWVGIIILVSLISLLIYYKFKQKNNRNALSTIEESVPPSKNEEVGQPLLETEINKHCVELSVLKDQLEYLNHYHAGLEKFNTLITNNAQSLEVLCQCFISNFVEFMNALQGTIYLKMVDGKNGSTLLKYFGGYNLQNNLDPNKLVLPGEGYLGTCFVEKKILDINPLPKGYIKIGSGLGEDFPNFLILIPVQYNETIEGVIELAGFSRPDERRIQLAERIVENLSSMISILRASEENKLIVEQLKVTVQENKQIQTQLSKQNALLDALLNNIPDYIYFKDDQSRFIRISQSMVNLFSGATSTHDLIGKSDFDFQDTVSAKKYFEEEQHIMNSLTPIIDDIHHEVFDNGVEQWVSVTKMPLIDNEGNLIGTFGISKDITNTKKLEIEAHKKNQELQTQEEELRQNLEEMVTIQEEMEKQIEVNKQIQMELNQQNTLLVALLNNIPDYIYFKDVQSRFIRISKSMVNLFTGAALPEDLIGKSDFDFQEPETAQKYFEEEKEIMKSGKPILNHIQHEIFDNGFEQWVAVTKMPLTDGEGNVLGTFGISKDITETKKLEIEANAQNQELQAQDEELRQNLEEMKTIQEELERQVALNQKVQTEMKQQDSLLSAILTHIAALWS